MLIVFRQELLLLCVAVLFPLAAGAQDPYALTPDEAVRLGLERSGRLEAIRAEAAEAQTAAREARGAALPTLLGQANYTRLSSNVREVGFEFPGLDTVFTILPIELNRYHTELSLEQPIFTGGRILNQIRAASRQASAAAWQVRQEEADLGFEIRRSYWQLYQASAVLNAAEAAIAQVEEHVRVVENRIAEGAALTSEFLAARTRRSEVQLERVDAENAVRIAQLELNRLIGMPLDRSPEVVVVDVEETAVLDLDTLRALALERPQLRALTDQVEALRFQLQSVRGGWLPEVGLVGRYVYARPNPYFFAEQNEFRGTGEVSVALQWTLFEGGRRGARVGQARARLAAAEARLSEARDQVVVEVTRQALEARRANQAVDVAEQHLAEAAEAFRVARQQYEEGAALSSDVLAAEQAYRAARARRAQSVAEVALTRAALLNAAGRVW